jgi:tight adherence protein C
MDLMRTGLLVLVFAAVFLLAVWGISRMWDAPLQRRVDALRGDAAQGRHLPIETDDDHVLWGMPARWHAVLRPLLERLAHLAAPREPGNGSAGAARVVADRDRPSWLRLRFLNAGVSSPNAMVSYFGLKALLTLVLPMAALAFISWRGIAIDLWMAAALVALAALGYYAPNLLLARAVERRQRALFETFPDALDLMRVCMEAGQGLDGAVDSVAREMATSSPVLAEELAMLSVELRAGTSRGDALRNLALRIGLDDIDMLVSTLIQADRFGTGLAESLRVHSDSLRIKRRLAAEERAARLPVLLLLPLVVCIFPSLLAVLMGPPVIRVLRVLVPAVAGSAGA